ncbi:uncharacterized protein THITE_2118892 [Thermothielavioides terrestris NRRL 8126]|uniref:Homeobox domain-containing protein n=2 Tax=Thermothielavioides terrestris TaxID=2587410 RepID=G2RB09_THETT|nr:uncharacterized protein THITE_2118892 [Thermothielavioides terrestris NRRL 8126]AEO68980.1 hypothetical protein THITE_2118892 [Thermothielavioides terrestris NRRL 8126]
MLHWGSDDLFVLPELEDLEKCLREHYNYETDIFSIPSENSHLELMLKIGDMVKKHESEDTLLIVYYGGHARIDESRQSTWCANRRPGSPWLQWSAIQTLLERSVSDVLILLDCCAGAASASFPTGQSITETISASSWDAIAPDPGRYSFTNALIEVLLEWRQRTFSAAMLHAEVLARLKHPRPILINGKQFEARSTPVHFMMTSNHKAPSIEICRLVPPNRLPPSPPNELAFWNRPTLPRMIEGRNPAEPYPRAPDFRIPAASDPNEDEPHVLISLALEDDQRLDLNDWETWLAAFPAIAKYVKVQGVFKSHSTLLLLSLPVMVWDFLPDDPACSFVAFIRSNNLLRPQTSGSEAAADSRVHVTSEGPVSTPMRDDAESCLSGTTYGPTESFNLARRGIVGPNISRNPSTASAPYRDPPADYRLPQRAGTSGGGWPEYAPADVLSQPGPSAGLRVQPSMGSLGGSLRNVPSTASLATLERRQLGPLAMSAAAGHDLPAPGEGITRTMILNQSRSSKKSVFLSDQDVPQGQQMAPHVLRRLEYYFQKDPDPSIGVVEHLASNLGVETSDIHVWFHHRREQERMTYNLQNLKIEHHHGQAQDGAVHMILPGHLNRLLEIYPSKGVLLVDLRSSTDFERSHIHDAINLRAPVSFVEHTSLEMIEDTFMDDQSRRSFSKWSQFKCIVFYDRVIEFDWECPVAEALYTKFRRKGWQGQCFILKGHYREFSASFDKHISGAKMTGEAKEYLDSLRQQSSPTEGEARRRDEEYREFLNLFTLQHPVPIVDLIPARKLERLRAVEQNQKELEVEFETRFPALYKKAQAMRPAPAMDEPPSPAHPSPPPPFYRDLRTGQSFKDVDWAGAGKGDEDDFTARKAALVEPLASGLEKMRDASNLQRADSTTSSRGHHEDYPEKFRRDFYADDYEHDFDEIDPKSEGLRNDPGFQKAGAPSPAGIEPGTAVKAHERAGGEDTLKKGSKKRPQLWGRLRSGATK